MIHLINMPFGSIQHPNLALGLIKSQLAQNDITSIVHNLNILFAQMIGFSGYEYIAMFKGVDIQASEWLFARAAWREDFGPPEDDFLDICDKELPPIPKVSDKKAWLKKIRQQAVPQFFHETIKQLTVSGPPQIVGFSCLFFQTISSLALGRILKETFPDIKLVYGGPCFHGEMGEELIHKVPWIDVVSTGEADDVIVPLFESLLNGDSPSGLQGIMYRDQSGNVCSDIPSRPVSKEVLEFLPEPDFDDYFNNSIVSIISSYGPKSGIFLLLEGSRGCWWGQKHHCTFCGLNGNGIGYRAKTGQRVFKTISEYAHTYPSYRYHFTDNNISMTFFKDLFPLLKNSKFKDNLSILCEVRVTLKRKHLKAMSEAGIKYLQPGIESLSTHLLTLLNKGTTLLQNLYFLKMCREYNFIVIWNNLIRIPGEKSEDYQKMEALIPKILHLAPPHSRRGTCPIECHRFSPYFCEKGRWLENYRPQPWYNALFPAHRIDISRVAYYFDAQWKDTLPHNAYNKVTEMCRQWSRIWGEEEEIPRLYMKKREGGALDIVDTRKSKHSVAIRLEPDKAMVYQALSDPVTIQDILASVYTIREKTITPHTLKTWLDEFIETDLAVEEQGKYLSLALSSETSEPPLEQRHSVYVERL
jgi:ribosomal peptide maturation radical SAM protein 1